MTRKWLGTVLRARSAQEDVAAQRLAGARRDARRAVDHLSTESDRVAAMPVTSSESAMAFQASAAARAAAVATLTAARHRVTFAESRVKMGVEDLTSAARARRTVEKLHERDTAAEVAGAAGAAQRELDEVAIARHGARQRGATQ